MQSKKKPATALLAISLALTTIAAEPATANTLTGGELSLFHESSFGAWSEPEEFVVVDETLYFLAETERHGLELYSYRDGEATLHDLVPGGSSSGIEHLFPLEGGVGFLINQYSSFFDDFGYRVGLMRDGVTTWLHDEDFDYSTSEFLVREVNGEHLIMVDSDQEVFLKIDEYAVSGGNDTLIEAPIETAEFVDVNLTTQSPQSLQWDDILVINEISSIGPYLIADIVLPHPQLNALYYLDTRQDVDQWQWYPLVSNAPLSNDGASQEFDFFRISGESIYVFFNKEIQRFTLNEDEILRADEVVPGVSQWEWNSEDGNYFWSVQVFNGQIFFEGDEDHELYWLSPDGVATVAGDSAGDLADGFNLNRATELDGVLYFRYQENLLAWEYQADLIYLAYQSLTPYSQPLSAAGRYDIAAVGKSILFPSNTIYGAELVELNTLRDVAQVIDIDASLGYSQVIDVEALGETVYFYEMSPEDDATAYLMRERDGIVDSVKDSAGNILRIGLSYPVELPNMLQVAQDGKLYALASENSAKSPAGIGNDYDIALWVIEANGSVEKLQGMAGNNGAGANMIYNPSASPAIFVAIENWDAPTFWALDISSRDFFEFDTQGVSFHSSNNQTIMEMGGKLFTTTGPRNDPEKVHKFALIDENSEQLTLVDLTDGLGQPNSDYTSSEFNAVEILKVVNGGTDGVYTALVSNYKGATAANYQSEKGVAVISWDNAESEIVVSVIIEGFNGPMDVQIIDVFFVENGPNGNKHLLVQFWDDSTGPTLGRMAYFPFSSLPGSGQIDDNDNNNSPLQLSRSFQNVLEDGGYELDVLSIPSIYDPQSNLLFVPNMGDGVHSYQVFSGDAFNTSETLGGAEELGEFGYFGQDRYLYLPKNAPIAGRDSKLYFPIWYRNMDSSSLFEFDPFGTPSYEPTNASNAVASSFYRDLAPRVPPRPLSAEANVTLKSNFVGGPNDYVLRGSGSVTLDGSVFSRPGFELVGWSETANGAASYEPNANFNFASSTWLYAVWRQVTVTVTVPIPVEVAKGSSVVSFTTPGTLQSLSSITVAPGDVVELPELQMPGYRFEGWTENSSGHVFSGAYRPAGSVNLNPTFSPLTLQIFLAPVQGLELPLSLNYTAGEQLELPTPVLKGHTFVGWIEVGSGERVTKGWHPTEATMLIPEFRIGGPDHTVAFWQTSASVSHWQMSMLDAFATKPPGLQGYRTLVITGFDSRSQLLARKRALNVAIKLRKLGYTNSIELQAVVAGGSKSMTQIVGLLED